MSGARRFGGLCEMVRVELITLAQATDLFGQARVKAAEQGQQEALAARPERPA